MISEHFATIAAALSPRYRVERLLQGGVAAYVYLAEDRTLGRRVAVKVLRDEMSATVNADRFMAEIRVAGELRHPNIVPVYDSGDVEGLPYYVMPFIDGETLRDATRRASAAFRWRKRCASPRTSPDALDFAHRHRVVHRDIKPENVMLEGGRALVLDFGIALALERRRRPRAARLTRTRVRHHPLHEPRTGRAPTAAPRSTARSDVYSLACVVYEMLCGRPPFTGKPNAVIRRHLAEQPRPLAAVCPGAPPKIGAVLSCALQKAPAAGRGPGRQLRRSGRRREQGERRGGEDADGGETPGEGHGRTLDRPFRGGPGRSPGRFVSRSDHRCTRPEALAGTAPGTPGRLRAFPEVSAPRSAQDGLRGTDEAVPTWETARSAVAPERSPQWHRP